MDLAKTLAGSAVVALLIASGCGNGNGDGGGGGAEDASVAADGGVCPPGLTFCVDDSPSCEDLQSSGGNCGACNNKCPSGTSCQAGVCRPDDGDGPDAGNGSLVCGPGLTLCVDDTPSCEDLTSSGGNCGACNNKCPSGTSCDDGVCQ